MSKSKKVTSVSAEELADLFGCSDRLIRQLAEDGIIPPRRPWALRPRRLSDALHQSFEKHHRVATVGGIRLMTTQLTPTTTLIIGPERKDRKFFVAADPDRASELLALLARMAKAEAKWKRPGRREVLMPRSPTAFTTVHDKNTASRTADVPA
jgi:hypothetical protein